MLGIVICLCLTALPAMAQTPVEDLFELDGNLIDETLIGDADDSLPDDWGEGDGSGSTGYVAGPSVDGNNPGGDAGVSAFINDPNGDTGTDNIFTGGGSKDDLPINGWKWTQGTPPDKDDLLQVGAAAYVQGDELLIYDFGTLYAENGTSSIGNWFFKKDIGPCSNGKFGVVDSSVPSRPCLPDAQQPDELHTVGDILVISENGGGGKIAYISVYKWVGGDVSACPGGAANFVPPKDNLCVIGEFAGATCDGVPGTDPWACGVMNDVMTESIDTYGYLAKSPPNPSSPFTDPAGTDGIQTDDHPAVTFFESGINISVLLGGAECFSSFLKNTRTSASTRSQLKDFAGGAFELCGIDVVKTCPSNRTTATGGYCEDSDLPCDTNANCDVGSSEQCVMTNPQFLFGDTVRTQFAVTISKKGPAALANVELTEVTLDGCYVVAEDGVALTTAISLPQSESTPVLASLSDSATLTLECDSSLAVTSQKVIAKATTVSGLSQVGPEEFTLLDENCKPAPVPGLHIDKVCNGQVALGYDGSGNLQFNVPVKITVTNTGDEDLSNIVVSDNKYGLITDTLSLDKGDPPAIYELSYDTDVPDGTAPWLGCNVQFSDEASVDAAIGAYSGSLSGAQLPLKVPATCVFCPNSCPRTP
jgi:hypothetical protein